MAKFCQNCGTALGEGTKFCPGCGTPIPQAVPQQPVQPQQPQQQPQYQQPQPQYQQPQPQYQQPAPQQRQYTPQPQVHIPEQSAKKNAARAQKPAPVKKKKGMGGLVAVIVILLVAAIGVVCFFGFRDGGWFRGDSQDRPTSYDGQNSFEALLDYANRLEDAGNEEAAARVRALIPEAAAGEAHQKAYEQQKENDELQMMEDMEDLLEAYNLTKGGKGK